MKHILFLLLMLLPIHGIASLRKSSKGVLDYVDLFVGTSNSRWMLGPYASVPYGMVQLGPDNQDGEWMAGYEYSFASVRGFSHIHAYAHAGLLIMPAAQDFTQYGGSVSSAYRGAGAGYHSRMLKNTEKAYPGYYGCELYDAECKAEMTATTHCGFHRYTFHEKDNVRILLSSLVVSEYTPSVVEAHFEAKNNKEVEGYARMRGIYGDYTLYFAIEFNKAFKNLNGWVGDKVFSDVDSVHGKDDVGAFVNYATREGEEIMLKVGLSLVDIEGARNNLHEELAACGWDFEAVARQAAEEWEKRLSSIEVYGDERDKKKFYTNFYRAICKQTWSDCDGRYRDTYGKIHQLPQGQKMYGGDAFWNTYWNVNTLLSLVHTDLMNGWVQTQLELYKEFGWTNNGPTGLKMSGIMDVTHEIALMVSAYQKGIRDYDVEKLYEAVSHNSKEQGKRFGFGGMGCLSGMEYLNVYDSLGYVPYEMNQASRTLDYAFTDYCAAQLAKSFGKEADYKLFLKRSGNWRNQLHPELKYQVPRSADGSWKTDFNKFSGEGWVEGNSWQYTWYVPHDVPGLVEAIGRDTFNNRLEEGFEKSRKHKFAAHAFDRYQPIPFEYYINHGNEANMQASFLFNYAGKPWLTQKYSREILDVFYGDTPYEGWGGDEDEGQMGAWFVIASMGLFEMDGGVTSEPQFDLSSPLFDKVVIHIDPRYNGGKPFVIKAVNNSPQNIYIQSATLNGTPLQTPKIRFKDVVAGGTLVLKMGPEPNYKWGI